MQRQLMAVAVAPPVPPPLPAEPLDPLFFAEEFAARRRRFVPVNVQISKIAERPVYKNYNFPFIMGKSMNGTETSYPLLFDEARNTSFQPDPGYIPTTRFEAMTYEMYKQAITPAGGLEIIRNLFVDSLLEPGLLVDLSRLRAAPTVPVHTGTEFDTPVPPTVPAAGIPSSRTLFLEQLDKPKSIEYYYYIGEIYLKYMLSYLLDPATNVTYLHLRIVFSLTDRYAFGLRGWKGVISPQNPDVIFLDRSIIRVNSDLARLRAVIDRITGPAAIPNIDTLANFIINNTLSVAKATFTGLRAANPGLPYNAPVITQGVLADITRLTTQLITAVQPGLPVPPPAAGIAALPPPVIDIIGPAAAPVIANVGQAVVVTAADKNSIYPVLRDLLDTVNAISAKIFDNAPPPAPGTTRREYLSRDFVGYLTRLSAPPPVIDPSSPTPCQQVLYKDRPVAPPALLPLVINMDAFAISISAESLSQQTNPEYVSRLGLGNSAALALVFGCPKTSPTFDEFVPISTIIKRIGGSTIEEVSINLQNITGDPLERYLQFIRFVYILFDHIPAAQPVISALMFPLVGMYNGIIERGRAISPDDSNPLLLQWYSPDGISQNTTFSYADTAFVKRPSRQAAVHAVISMYGFLKSSRNAIKSLLGTGSSNPGRHVKEVGYSPPTVLIDVIIRDIFAVPIDDDRPLDSKTAKVIYDSAGIAEFNLPSTGGAHMVLPYILGVKSHELLSMVYELSARWFSNAAEYEEMQRRIRESPDAISKYRQYSTDRIAHTQLGIAAFPVLPVFVAGNSVNIIPIPLPPPNISVYVLDWQPHNLNYTDRYLSPRSWAELLYPAYVSYAIVELQVLRDIAATLVSPCLQDANASTVFPSIDRLTGGGVACRNEQINNDPLLMAAIFEFPADVVKVHLPPTVVISVGLQQAFNHYPGGGNRPVGGVYQTIRRPTTSVAEQRNFNYNLVDALNINDMIPDVTAWSTNLFLNTESAGVPHLRHRTRYAWTHLGDGASDPSRVRAAARPVPAMLFGTPSSGRNVFLPAINTELFLSSFFDWKLQLHYLSILRRFLRGRDHFAADLRGINLFIGTLSPEIRGSLDNSEHVAYVISNLVTSDSVPYTGFRNVLFNISGPASSPNLSEILKMKEVINSFNLSRDTLRFYVTQAVVPVRGPLVYDIDIKDYIDLAVSRSKAFQSLAEKPDVQGEREQREKTDRIERDISQLLKQSAVRLKDPYSVLVDEIVTRALYPS